MIVLLAVFYACCIFAGGNRASIEDVDYAVAISILAENTDENANERNGSISAEIGEESKFKIRLYVADLVEYRGSSNQMLETIAYTYDVGNVGEVFELYREEKGRELSLSHVKKISVDELAKAESSEKSCDRILAELTDYVDVSDAVSLKTGNGETGFRSFLYKKIL
jgi:hypothetical protein